MQFQCFVFVEGSFVAVWGVREEVESEDFFAGGEHCDFVGEGKPCDEVGGELVGRVPVESSDCVYECWLSLTAAQLQLPHLKHKKLR